MRYNVLKRVKIFEIVCFLLIFIEIGYIFYSLFLNNTEYLYFDGINAIDKNSNYYVTVGSDNNNSNHYERAQVSTYNKKRDKKIETLYNVGYNSAFFGVSFDQDNIVAVGSYEKTMKEHKESRRRALIVKYDMNGNVIFQKDFQVLDNSKFTNIQIVNDGYYVTGQSVYKNTKVGDKEGGAILAKYDKEGNFLWSKVYGNNKFGKFNDLLIVDGSIYTVGVDENYVGILCKYDMNGSLSECVRYENCDELGFNSIVSFDDKIYVSGSKGNKGHFSAVILMYDMNCSYLDEIFLQNERDTHYNKLMIDNYGYLVAIGLVSYKSNFSNKKINKSQCDGIIGKYKMNLEKINVVTYEYDRDDLFTDIIDNDGEYLVVGYSSYDDVYLSKFIRYSEALKVLDVES